MQRDLSLPHSAFRSGDGAYSDYSNVITVWTPPCSPTAAQARNLAANAIELTWQDNSDDESEFQIERRPGNSSTWSQIDTVLANIHSYTDDQVECSTPYSYRVRAYRAHDQRYSDYSKVATGSTRPCTPTDLQADLASSDSVTLTWQDASPDETEFKVERSMDEGATWAVVGAAPANSTTHTDVGLSCSTSYFYRVHAFRSGDGAYSDYSNVASVHTPPCAPTNARASNQISGTVEWPGRTTPPTKASSRSNAIPTAQRSGRRSLQQRQTRTTTWTVRLVQQRVLLSRAQLSRV